jgi:hypothetical protein
MMLAPTIRRDGVHGCPPLEGQVGFVTEKQRAEHQLSCREYDIPAKRYCANIHQLAFSFSNLLHCSNALIHTKCSYLKLLSV